MQKHKPRPLLWRIFGMIMALAITQMIGWGDAQAIGTGLCLLVGETATVPVEEFRKGLSDIGEQLKVLPGLQSEFKTLSEANGKLQKELDEAKGHLDGLRKSSLRVHRTLSVRAGEISEECARWIGGVTVLAADAHGRLQLETGVKEKLLSEARTALGLQTKAALTSADIPLPVEYSGEVIELVTMWGKARQYCTLFPLGGSSVKLPRLTTSPAFGFVAQSAAIAEKSPQVAWVTFTPSKLGGLIRLPSELDADSIVQIGRFVARYAARETARMEDLTAFIGDGTATYDSKTGLTKYVVDQAKFATLVAGGTRTSNLTLAKAREMRSVPNSSVLGTAAYYFHPTMEQLFSSFNTAGDKPYIANGINGASLDGFPIRWVDALPAYNTNATINVVFGLFGDLSFAYLGIRGGYRFDTSADVFFTTDEIAIRALERFDVQMLATDFASGVRTAAA